MNNKLTMSGAFTLLSSFMVLILNQNSTRDVMVLDAVATACQMFFSSTLYDQEKLLNKKHKFPR